jgi:hypothetical protein
LHLEKCFTKSIYILIGVKLAKLSLEDQYLSSSWTGSTCLTKDPTAMQFANNFDENHLTQHVDFHTFQLDSFTGPSSTLDLILTDIPQRIFSLTRGAPLGSTPKGRAHLTLEWDFSTESSSSNTRQPYIKRHVYSKDDYTKFDAYINSIDW